MTSEFTLPAPFEKQPDQQRIVATLSAESHVPIDDVAALYGCERASSAVGAHITNFLHIFAVRSVQEILRKRTLDERPRPLGGVPAPGVKLHQVQGPSQVSRFWGRPC